MKQADKDYFERRVVEEAAHAEVAADARVGAAHRALSMAYLKRLAMIEAIDPEQFSAQRIDWNERVG